MSTFEFDFSHVQTPFAMRPGLLRLDAGATHFTAIDTDHSLHAEKTAVWMRKAAWNCAKDFDPRPALAGIAKIFAIENIANKSRGCSTRWQNDPFFTDTPAFDAANVQAQPQNATFDPQACELAARSLSLSVAEDFCVIDGDKASPHAGTVPLMCVCVPSHWAPEEKVGLSFAAIHAPVADNALIMQASDHLVRLATSGQSWQRFVWTLSPSGRHDQHPHRHSRTAWPGGASAEQFAGATHFRAERQTLFALRGSTGEPTGQAIFTIKVMLKPLMEVVETPVMAQRLQASLSSMSDFVLAYKGLASAKKPLLAWLEARSRACASNP